MPRFPFVAVVAATLAFTAAEAQTARTDAAPVRPAQPLVGSPDAAPDAVPAAEPSDADIARRLAAFYQRQAALLEADAAGRDAEFAVQLDELVADVQAAALRPGALTDPRFRELYSSVMTEYERFYDQPVLTRGESYAINAAGVEAVERGFDLGTPLLEHVTLPDAAAFVSTVPMDVNPKVERYVQFLLNRPSHVQRLRSRADTYFPMVERILAEEGVPDELKYLAMVESALNPVARSHAAAVGMWQFISATGRAYGLRAEREIDDRMDPETATRAAAQHLRDLYDRFGDWQLALAGYNCNPAVIARGVRRFEEQTGRRATFWDIDHVIPRETRAYVPMFIATSLILSNPDAYGFEAHEPGPTFTFDRIPVSGGTRLSEVARILEIDTEVVAALNPSLRQGRVPDVRVPHMLRIPTGSYVEHADRLDGLAPPEAQGDRFAAETVHFGPRAVRPLAPQEHGEALVAYAVRSDARRTQSRQQRARRTDPVEAYIAAAPSSVNRAEAQVAEARREARLQTEREQAQIAAASTSASESAAEAAPVVDEIAEVELAVEAPVAAQRVAVARPAAVAPAPPTTAPPVRTVSDRPEAPTVYRARRGDYLVSIARRHGMTLSQLRALNPGIGDGIRVGQSIRVSGTPAAPVATRTEARRPTTHRVRSGEHLTGIAREYGVSVRQLRDWNGLSSDVIRVGQRLRLTARGTRG